MRKVLNAVMVLLAAAVLTGMGGVGGAPEGTVPKTDEDIKAKIVDRSGVSTEVSRFSMDGKVFLSGQRGEGQMNVFFRDLKKVNFGEVSGDEIPADLLLRSGEKLELKVRKRAVFYGSTGYAAFRIPAANVGRIDFAE